MNLKIQSVSAITFFLLCVAFITINPTSADAQIYYSANQEIRVIPVGETESQLLTEADAYGIAVDLEGELIYWSEFTSSGSHAIKRAGLDGSDVTTINDHSTTSRGLRLDLENDKIYWVDLRNDGEILRADLSGENTEVLVAGETDGVTDGTLDLSLDLENEKIYWVKMGGVMRSDLDGSNAEVVVEITSHVQPTSVEVNPRDGYVYWTDNDNIKRADTETGETSVLINAVDARGISIDVDNNKIYWMDQFWSSGTGQLNLANLDGTGEEMIMETGATRGAIAGFGWEISTSNESVTEQPSVIRLNQNYPNPFNPQTVIEFTLPETMEISLIVYNSLGQQVSTLAENAIHHAGTHQVGFNASFLPSGIYLYKLQAGEFSLTQKMTLLK